MAERTASTRRVAVSLVCGASAVDRSAPLVATSLVTMDSVVVRWTETALVATSDVVGDSDVVRETTLTTVAMSAVCGAAVTVRLNVPARSALSAVDRASAAEARSVFRWAESVAVRDSLVVAWKEPVRVATSLVCGASVVARV